MKTEDLCVDPDCSAPSHDSPSGYHYGCRSTAARKANARESKHRRLGIHSPRWIENVGVGRKLRALAAMGWHVDTLAVELGITRSGVNKIRGRTRHNVDTVKRVAALYDRLGMTPGGDDLTAAIARGKGWPGPLAWDDPDNSRERPKYGEATDRREGRRRAA